ncbi:MAG: membrane protein insertase YidC [Hyphomicrobiaceae bacterium]
MSTRDPDNSQNVLIALVLSMLVLFAWQYFYAGPKIDAEKERAAQQTPTQKPGDATSPQPTASPPQGAPGKSGPSAATPGGAPVAPTGAPVAPPAAGAKTTRQAALAGAPRIAIETPSIKGSIPLKGARIDDIVLAKYRETANPTSPNVVLFSPVGAPEPYFAEFGWVSDGAANIKVPGRDTEWMQEGSGALTPDNPVTLTWNNGAGLTFKRTISVDQNYLFTVSEKVENATGADVTLFPYGRIYRFGTPLVQGYYILHEGLIGVAGENGLQEITYKNAIKQDGAKSFKDVVGGWLGITDKYWAAALIPDQKTPYRANFFASTKAATGATDDSYQTDYLLDAVKIAGGQSHTVEQRLYAGAKQVGIVEDYQTRYGIKQFDLMIDWGWFYFITKPLFYLIDWLYKLVGNFGIAILATTVLVKAAFFPLANKSYESMAKMKKLQPEMENLRERFKDDKARQQQELMKLYQEQKINPLAGCLPILLQIPVFFALYKVLFVTIDMRHAPFYGWIKDLSAPDPTSLFNLFGLLPFDVPPFLHIGIWPVLMGITMWVQMQLNPKQPDPTQQMIFNWMPVLFTFMLGSFPAGLVIYWAWNNVLSIAQQATIMKRQGADIPLKDNIKATFAPLGRLMGGGRQKK